MATPVLEDGKSRHYKYWGLGLTVLGFACEFLTVFVGVSETFFLLGIGLSVLGLALYAKAKGHSPVGGGILGLLPFVGPFIGLIGFTFDKPKQSAEPKQSQSQISRVLNWSVVGLMVGGGIILVTQRGENNQQMVQNSAPIIQALSKYKKDHAQFPETLDQLVPQYVSEIPKCKSSSQLRIIYIYRKEQDAYELNCYTGMFNKHRYKSITAEWDDWD